ncbi:hypothetical protein [Edaphobacter dinghuensis]|uniref:MucB/RseB-like sigma(E) regulatory protein n=1 Tax=Edaphobacter dinghuensis TaxID=1560005 RepID=A0A917M5Z0_9BACT|nr:hypothetical protein [Edaphobacter dinghuensis]GGG80080.1 hypothetical protein GCM10011585_24270 [Edaphobacter dinghuensis]
MLKGRWIRAGFLGLSTCLAGLCATAQSVPANKPDSSASLSAEAPRSWIVDAAANELRALHHPNSYLRYRMHTIDLKGDQVRDVIESKDGSIARLILRDGRPLTEEEDKAERQRLNNMIASPSDYFKHVKNDGEGRKLADQLIRLMPDAMIYTYTPGQPQTGKNNGTEVVLDYKPNPKFSPPSAPAQALTGLEGRMWIDAKSHEVVRMEGTIFRAVNFGWGMVAHIYPGGHLVLEQENAGNNRWIFTKFQEDVSVRALMVKTIHVHTNVEAGSFQTLPGPIPYQDAIRMLLDTPLPKK